MKSGFLFSLPSAYGLRRTICPPSSLIEFIHANLILAIHDSLVFFALFLFERDERFDLDSTAHSFFTSGVEVVLCPIQRVLG